MVLREYGNTWEKDFEVPPVGIPGRAFALRDGNFQRYEKHIPRRNEIPGSGSNKTQKQFQLHVLVACDAC